MIAVRMTRAVLSIVDSSMTSTGETNGWLVPACGQFLFTSRVVTSPFGGMG